MLAADPADAAGSMHLDHGPAQDSLVVDKAWPAAAALLLRDVGAGSQLGHIFVGDAFDHYHEDRLDDGDQPGDELHVFWRQVISAHKGDQ